MNRIEFIARRLCAADGCPPEAPAIRAGRQLLSTPVIQLVPQDTAPAWHFYVKKAYEVLQSADIYASIKTSSDENLMEIASRDIVQRSEERTEADLDMDGLR